MIVWPPIENTLSIECSFCGKTTEMELPVDSNAESQKPLLKEISCRNK
jgi:hypothetical protein